MYVLSIYIHNIGSYIILYYRELYVYIVLLTTLHFIYRYIINGSVIDIYVIDNMFIEYIILSEYVCAIDISMHVIDK